MSNKHNNAQRPSHNSNESADPSRLYGRQFPGKLRDAIAEKAKELGATACRNDLVGTEYRVLCTLETIASTMIDGAEALMRDGTGYNSAHAPLWDFQALVALESYFPRDKREQPAPQCKPSTPTNPVLDAAQRAALDAASGGQQQAA